MDDPSKLTAPDSGYFEDGRIILIYEGEVDGCKEHSRFNKNLGVEDVGDRVKITVNYDKVPADEEGCSTSLRPYSVYHIKTRKELDL